MWKANAVHPDLLYTKTHLYNLCGFICQEPIPEKESAEYGAYTFKLNDSSIVFRVAKITPTKVGQFVTLWKRIGKGSIQPFDISDPVDFFIVSTRKDNQFGQFIFPKSVLCEQDVVSIKGRGGKRAIRVYPPWDKDLNRQAQKTQVWQMKYFLEMPKGGIIDAARVQELYSIV